MDKHEAVLTFLASRGGEEGEAASWALREISRLNRELAKEVGEKMRWAQRAVGATTELPKSREVVG